MNEVQEWLNRRRMIGFFCICISLYDTRAANEVPRDSEGRSARSSLPQWRSRCPPFAYCHTGRYAPSSDCPDSNCPSGPRSCSCAHSGRSLPTICNAKCVRQAELGPATTRFDVALPMIGLRRNVSHASGSIHWGSPPPSANQGTKSFCHRRLVSVKRFTKYSQLTALPLRCRCRRL